MMKAARLYGPKDLRIMEIPKPEIGDSDVRIRVQYCGICATDYSIYSGESSFVEAGMIRFPMTLGHEYSGVVDAVGKNVTEFKPGDRVIADTCITCGMCAHCRSGNYLRCEKMQAVGTINAKDGGFAEYTSMPERHVFHLPDSLSYKEGALVEPVGTGFHAVRQGAIEVGDNVLIIGTGPIGLGGVPFARYSGAKNVILAGRKPYKLDVGKKMGADVVINTQSEDLYKRVMEVTDGKGPDVIVESSGNIDMFNQAAKMIAMGGRLSVVAFYEQRVRDLDIDLLVIKDVKIISVMGNTNTAYTVMAMMESGKMDFMPLVTHIVPLDDVKEALDSFKTNNQERIKILLEV